MGCASLGTSRTVWVVYYLSLHHSVGDSEGSVGGIARRIKLHWGRRLRASRAYLVQTPLNHRIGLQQLSLGLISQSHLILVLIDHYCSTVVLRKYQRHDPSAVFGTLCSCGIAWPLICASGACSMRLDIRCFGQIAFALSHLSHFTSTIEGLHHTATVFFR